MSLELYMDHHVPSAITEGLRNRGVSVLTAFEDGAQELEDPQLLDRASSFGRVLFTFDDDLLTEATHRQRKRSYFAGVIYAHELYVTIGQCINDLELMCKVYERSDVENRILWIPLR